ncbi:MAG: ATP-binding protein [Pseudonocardiales bacterium]
MGRGQVGGGAMGAGIDVSVRAHGQVRVVRPQGVLTERTGAQLCRALATELLNHHRVVVDLAGFGLARASCVTVFPAALDQCGGWPRVRLVLCRPDQRMAQALEQRRVSALVPVYQLLLEAEEAIERRPALVRTRIQLGCDDRAPDVAGRLVRDTCTMWQVDAESQQIAKLVVSELVDNVVRHAHTAAVLTLEQGDRGLRIAVRDGAPGGLLSGPSQGNTGARRPGRGLELVARLATSWGIEMHPVGKTVWAQIAHSK